MSSLSDQFSFISLSINYIFVSALFVCNKDDELTSWVSLAPMPLGADGACRLTLLAGATVGFVLSPDFLGICSLTARAALSWIKSIISVEVLPSLLGRKVEDSERRRVCTSWVEWRRYVDMMTESRDVEDDDDCKRSMVKQNKNNACVVVDKSGSECDGMRMEWKCDWSDFGAKQVGKGQGDRLLICCWGPSRD